LRKKKRKRGGGKKRDTILSPANIGKYGEKGGEKGGPLFENEEKRRGKNKRRKKTSLNFAFL